MVFHTPSSNPLPPPPPRRKSDGQESLSNADFRRMVMETPRRVPEESRDRPKKKEEKAKRAPPRKYRPPRPKEDERIEKMVEDVEQLPKYRDRAKERREDQNPDYEDMGGGMSTLRAVAPPGPVELQSTDLQNISIAKSKYLGGDVEHTHLVKGLDYALLNKVRSEIEKQPETLEEEPPEEEARPRKEDEPVFHTAAAKVVYKWVVKPPTLNKVNEMFLPGRMAFAFDMEEMVHHIPTTVYRSKHDCPAPEEYVAAGVDAVVTDRIAKIMQYLKLGTSGKKKKKEKSDVKTKPALPTIDEDRLVQTDDDKRLAQTAEQPEPESKMVEDKPSTLPENQVAEEAPKLRSTEDDIFEDAGTDYVVTVTNADRSPASEDMEESPREGPSYFQEGQETQDWEQYGPVQGPAMPPQGYPAAPEAYYGEYPYAEQYYNQVTEFPGETPSEAAPSKDPRFLSQEEKDRGMSSVFKRDDQTLRQRRELDAREKDPNYVSESYSECYPGYQEYNREIVDSDDDDLSKMDMGGKAKGRLHRWDFETEEEWAKYNDQKEAMPKAAFQFGVKMQDGRKTRKQNKDQKLNNELHKINQILEKKKRERGGDDNDESGKRVRF